MGTDPISGLRSAMVDELIAGGALRSERWIQAFMSEPRHEFLREFYILNEVGTGYVSTAESSEEERLRLVYTDEAWTTQLDDDIPTSSSSAPSLMARMLEALNVTDSSTVLELGTGTGYNAALLCAGLSDQQVTSVDIDAGLVEQARDVLARLGHHPKVYAAVGETPAPGLDRFDRLIATYGVPRIPFRWVELSTVGGIIVAPLYREQPVGAMVRLTVEEPGRAVGRFLPFYGGFMPTRRGRPAVGIAAARSAADRDNGAPRVSELPPLSLGLAPEQWEFYAAVALGDVQHVGMVPDEGGEPEHWLVAPDSSWAFQRVDAAGQAVIREGGPRRLWAELETAYTRWHDLGKPERERFGLTVTAGRQELWLDDPTNVIPDH